MKAQPLRRAFRAALVPLVAAAVLAQAQPASSAPTVPAGDTFSFDLPGSGPGSVCDFPVRLSGFSAQEARATLPNGLVVVTGPGVLTVTNLDTKESLTYNISGPSLLDPITGTATFFGTNVVIGPEGQVGPEGPFLIYTAGPVTVTPDQPLAEPPTGVIIQDICAALTG
jgi:hypothetical protein